PHGSGRAARERARDGAARRFGASRYRGGDRNRGIFGADAGDLEPLIRSYSVGPANLRRRIAGARRHRPDRLLPSGTTRDARRSHDRAPVGVTSPRAAFGLLCVTRAAGSIIDSLVRLLACAPRQGLDRLLQFGGQRPGDRSIEWRSLYSPA